MRDPYCYPDTETLRNRLGIMDDKELRVAEADYVSLNLAELAKENADRIFDFGELCRMHYRIFRDIFDWAGKIRVINIEKMEAPLGNISIEYSDTFDIERDARAVLKDMNLYDWKHASFDETVKNFPAVWRHCGRCIPSVRGIRGQWLPSAPCSLRRREFTLTVNCLRTMQGI